MKSRNSRILFALFAFGLTVFLSARIYYALTDDFRISNINYPLPKEDKWSVLPITEDGEARLLEILGQPYFYLGKGAQSYAFESQDGMYVLKFFKFKHLRPSIFIDLIPPVGPLSAYKEKQSARKARKLFGVFNAYRLAYEVDRDESGLIYIQLNTEDNPKRLVQLVDKIGFKHDVELESIPFILQKKGVTLRNVLSKLLNDGDVEAAKGRIGKILDMYAGEYRKGIYDHDHGVMQNTGFVGDEPIHLDVGKLVREDQMRDLKVARNDALLVANKIKAWLKVNFPQNYQELSAYIDEKII